jgi:hypothetical protein
MLAVWCKNERPSKSFVFVADNIDAVAVEADAVTTAHRVVTGNFIVFSEVSWSVWKS